MRTVLACVLLLVGSAVEVRAVADRTPKRKQIQAEKRSLQGNWVMVRWQKAGSVVLYNPPEKFHVWAIRGDRLTARQGALGWAMDCTFRIDPTGKPKRLDTQERSGPDRGKTGRYLYQLDGDTLTVCYRGLGQARPKDFTDRAAADQVVIVFTRLKS
jgi:uncharacterized protein (TIGR03067 family)